MKKRINWLKLVVLSYVIAVLINTLIVVLSRVLLKNNIWHEICTNLGTFLKAVCGYNYIDLIILGIVLLIIAINFFMEKQYWGIFTEMCVILFGVAILGICNTCTWWWKYLDIASWMLLVGFILYGNVDQGNDNSEETNVNESNGSEGKSRNKDIKKKIKRNGEKKLCFKNQALLNKIWHNIKNKIFNFFDRHTYILKRLTIALIVSLIELIIFTLWYGANFKQVKGKITNFLDLPLIMNQSAQDIISMLAAFVMVILPIIVIIISIIKVQYIKVKEIILSTNNILEIEKIYFREISYVIWLLACMFGILVLPNWKKYGLITANMIGSLWFILFAFSMILVLFLSYISDWIKNDSNSESLPRTAMLLTVITSIIVALIK